MGFNSQPHAPASLLTDSIYCFPLNRRLDGLQIKSDRFVGEKNLSLESDTCFLGRHRKDGSLSTDLSWLRDNKCNSLLYLI
jgi:hypothetical protein